MIFGTLAEEMQYSIEGFLSSKEDDINIDLGSRSS